MEKLKTFLSWKDLPELEALCDLIEEESANEVESRAKFDEAINTCGMDIMLGGTIFKKYIEFEVEELADLMETGAEEADIKKQKEKVVQLIHRQLSLPLIGNESALQEISEHLSQYFTEKDEKLINPSQMQAKYQKGLEKRSSRMIYEDKLFEDEGTSETIDQSKQKLFTDIWKAYIKFEISEKEFSRAQRLYDRALIHVPGELTLWCDYIDFTLFTIKSWPVLVSVSERALQLESFLTSAYMWQLHLLGLEMTKEPLEQVTRVVYQAMCLTFPSADDYMDLQSFKSDFLLRQLRDCADDSERVEGLVTSLRESLTELEQVLVTYYPDWAAGWLRYYKYATAVEEAILRKQQVYYKQHFDTAQSSAKDFTHCKVVWESAVSKLGAFQFVWVEYISWARSNHQLDLCRKLYKRAVQVVQDYKSAVAKDWLLFERENGSVQDLVNAMQHTKTVLEPWPAYQVTDTRTPPPTDSAETSTHTASSVGKRKEGDSARGEARATKKGRVENPDPNAAPTLETTIAPAIESPRHRTIQFADEITTSTTATDTIQTDTSLVYQQFAPAPPRVEPKDLYGNKVFVKSLPFTVSSEDIRAHILALLHTNKTDDSNRMEVTGEETASEPVFSVDLILSKAGKSRGLAIVDCSGGSVNPIELIAVLNGSVLGSRSVVACALDGTVLEENSVMLKPQVVKQGDNAEAGENAASGAGTVTPATSGTGAVIAESISAHHPTTVFVSKLPKEWTQEDLRSVFAECGEIVEVKIPVDKQSGQPKGHALVQFASEAGKKAALLKNRKPVRGHTISVLPSKFPALMPAPSRQNAAGATSSADEEKTSAGSNQPPPRYNPYLSTSTPTNRDTWAPKRTKLSLEDESNANSGRETDDLTTRRATPGLGYTAPAKSSSVLAFKPRTIKK